jgi:hypothetical protein
VMNMTIVRRRFAAELTDVAMQVDSYRQIQYKTRFCNNRSSPSLLLGYIRSRAEKDHSVVREFKS